MKKLLLLLFGLALVLTFFALGLHRTLTLDGLKGGLMQFQAWQAASPLLVGLAFFLMYVLVTALSLPGALIMTLAAGALFGVLWASLIVSLAASIGATLAFLASRYLFREAVQGRFGMRVQAINQGIARDGAFYLFTLRLVPVFPFFLVNLLMGLTPIRTRTYFLVSLVGMLPATFVFANAGTQLSRLRSLSDISSPGLWLSFTLLGVFPMLAKWCLTLMQRRRLRAK